MSLLPWRKWYAGLTGQEDTKGVAAVAQHITNTTINQVIQTKPFSLDEITDGASYERVAAGELSSGVYKSASTTDDGIIEIATSAETTTGTDTVRAVSPDGLAESIFGEKIVYVTVLASGTTLTTGDGKAYITIPDALNGMDLIDADASIYVASTSGTPTIAIYNATDGQDMLSTNITIDVDEKTSYTAATAPVINTTYDDVVTGDQIRVDVDVAGTGAAGLDVILTFGVP